MNFLCSPQNMYNSENGKIEENKRLFTELDSEGRMVSRAMTPYECQLEDDVEQLQEALFTISSDYDKIQFRLRQIASASAYERDRLLKDLERLIARGLDGTEKKREKVVPGRRCNSAFSGQVRAKQKKIFCQLRSRLEELAGAPEVCFQTDCCPTEGRSMKTCNATIIKSADCHIADQDIGQSKAYFFKVEEEKSKPSRHLPESRYNT
ncbi:uncharacterized protein LOC108146677 isoform X1 [Drosophila elegans]|uniref:uncharacterized protein LOC108146677 isoform X1 n=2 Tax=Drosophila elegans TaxID=30023 RepID=UPI0007E77C85|nr:uncharacterized protein LOC108146677 isoform X1 [Drosophila elegans]